MLPDTTLSAGLSLKNVRTSSNDGHNSWFGTARRVLAARIAGAAAETNQDGLNLLKSNGFNGFAQNRKLCFAKDRSQIALSTFT
jgi:hypothetical protein